MKTPDLRKLNDSELFELAERLAEAASPLGVAGEDETPDDKIDRMVKTYGRNAEPMLTSLDYMAALSERQGNRRFAALLKKTAKQIREIRRVLRPLL